MANAAQVKEVLKRLAIETPSWAYGNSGTRFKVFGQPGVPRDPYEKVADAAVPLSAAVVPPAAVVY